MKAYEISRSMMICLDSSKKRAKTDACKGCVMYQTEEYNHYLCRRRLHEKAILLLRDMAHDIEQFGGCTLCMHYDHCTRDERGTDTVLCSGFAYPSEGYRKYELERKIKKNGKKDIT